MTWGSTPNQGCPSNGGDEFVVGFSNPILLGIVWDAGLVLYTLCVSPSRDGLIEELTPPVCSEGLDGGLLEVPDLVCPPHHMERNLRLPSHWASPGLSCVVVNYGEVVPCTPPGWDPEWTHGVHAHRGKNPGLWRNRGKSGEFPLGKFGHIAAVTGKNLTKL